MESVNRRLILIYLIISISVFQAGVDFQLSMFIYYPPNYQCLVPNQTTSLVTPDNCNYYNPETPSLKQPCSTWIFDHSQIHSNLVTEMLLICQKQYLQLIIVPISCFIAILSIIFAYLSDLKGRKLMFLICVLLDTIIWILMGIFSSNYIVHVTLRSLKFFGMSAVHIGFVLASEVAPARHRNFILINYWILFSVGMSFSPVYFKYVVKWNHAWLLAAWPMVFYVVAPFILLESPKWLVINNQKKRAIGIWKQLDQYSNKTEEIPVKIHVNHVEGDRPFHTSKLLLLRLLILLLVSVSFNLVYQGISTNLEFAVSDIYINAVIMGLIEVPGGFLGYFSNNRFGSLSSMTFWTLIGGVAMLSFPDNWVPSIIKTYSGQISHSVLACFAKFFLIVAWSILSVFYVGLFPTNKRTFAYNMSSVVGYIGSGIGGFIGYYYKDNISTNLNVSNIIYGVILIVSIVLFVLSIPSVNNIELPNTVNEAEKIKKIIPCRVTEKESKTFKGDRK